MSLAETSISPLKEKIFLTFKAFQAFIQKRDNGHTAQEQHHQAHTE